MKKVTCIVVFLLLFSCKKVERLKETNNTVTISGAEIYEVKFDKCQYIIYDGYKSA